MIINKKNMVVHSVTLSGYEMASLLEAKRTLTMLFGKLTAKENTTSIYNILSALDCLIEELEDNNNSILEFHEEDK